MPENFYYYLNPQWIKSIYMRRKISKINFLELPWVGAPEKFCAVQERRLPLKADILTSE